MTTVWCIEESDNCTYSTIIAIYSTREKAEEALERKHSLLDHPRIIPIVVDADDEDVSW